MSELTIYITGTHCNYDWRLVEPNDCRQQPPVATSTSSVLVSDDSILCRRQNVQQTGQIQLDVQLATFVVNSTTEPHIICLFLNPSCSCLSMAKCYHLMAEQRRSARQPDKTAKSDATASEQTEMIG